MAATTAVEANQTLVRRLYEEFINGNDHDVLWEIYASDVVIHSAPGAEDLTGHDAIDQYVRGVNEAFPDMTATIASMVAADDLVAARITYTATHEGEYMGIPATGETATWDGTVFFRIAGGKIAEAWPMIDTLGLMQQLGVTELPSE
ncbi:ester cyclase [Haladaptatus sp. DJG-WS-42]|uniref:ester cyclase n=1 Tax=Haladaptatus sp. DJG-WS-42 TaxID=3120516 RepID=UPI0030D172BB